VAEKAGPAAPFRTVQWKARNERVNPRMSRISLFFGRLGPALVLSTALFDACNTSKASPAPPPPPQVSVITVRPERVSLSTEWIATLDGYVNAQIRPQVPGYLVRRDYEEGAIVRKDQVLFEIDPRPFEAALAQAQARLGEAQAQLGRTERDLERDRPLAEQRAIAQSQLDNDVQANLAAQAAIKSAAAAIDTARLNLGFTKVMSLIPGVAAIATAQIGDLVGPATLLTTVSQIDPIKAYFPLGEQDYLRMAGRINGRTASKQPWTGGTGLTLLLADGSVYPQHGSFLAADREIDPKTGTIRISAVFPNPTHMLRPGQYGRVRAETDTLDGAILVPQRAVTELQGSYQLRIVTPDNHVATRTVKLGERVGNRWIVAEGVKPDERVVVEGAQTRDGTVVNPKPFAAPGEGH
jgi:RND family efflux transporter MFP subunit